MNIPFAMSNVSEVVIGAIDASATLSAGGSGGASVFAGVVISAKGAPFELLSLTKSGYKRALGKPFHPSMGAIAEPMRHVAEAVEFGDGYVVRVVPQDAKYPYLTVAKTPAPQQLAKVESKKQKADEADVAEGSEVAKAAAPLLDTVTTSSAPYGTDVTMPEGALLGLHVVDGDPSTNRFVTMTAADAERFGEGMFHLIVSETNELGFEDELENILVSMKVDAVNDLGAPAYIETALENGSQYLRAIVAEGAETLTGFAKTALVGGTNGNMAEITPAQYEKAISVLRNAMVGYTAVLGLGCYDTTALAELAKVCDGRRIDGFFDAPWHLNYAGADQWVKDLNLNNHRIAMYHFPYTAKDPSTGARMGWGLSGVAFGAKAQGVSTVADVGGWHLSPAGEDRGGISRRAIKPLVGLDDPDYERMYRTRINKVAIGSGGQLVIDDAITCWKKEDYLRFQHVSSTMDAFSRAFYNLARTLKHQPDGVTLEGLLRGLNALGEKFESSGALVKPRDPDDGDEAFKIIIEPPAGGEIDLWKVTWALCVTGTSRRIFGQPVLMR